MALINMSRTSTREQDSKILGKTQTKIIPPTVKGGGNILDKMNSINALVATKLGKYRDKYIVIRTEDELRNYIDSCIANGICAIDTETTSLDPITTTIAGVCMYTVGEKACYIPINHVSYYTDELVKNQLSKEFVASELSRLVSSKIIMHNGKFDIRVIRNQLGITLNCYWDTMLASKCLNENESAGLKDLHLKYCKTEDTESLTYDKLFEGIEFTKIPISTAYLYASGDAIKTYELYEFQLSNMELPRLARVYDVFMNIEMPILKVVADMEDTGISIDVNYAHELSEKYHEILGENEKAFYEVLEAYQPQIEKYRLAHTDNKLSDPINISSPSQIAILLYDILGLKSPDKDKPRGTGEDILEQLNHPLSKVILDWRGTSKLLTTYIDKLPEVLNPKTNKIHCSFNQYGAKTGRMSSSDPNVNWAVA